MATKTTVVIGTATNGDTEATSGSIAEAVNAVTTAAATVISVSTSIYSWASGYCQIVAVIVWTEQT